MSDQKINGNEYSRWKSVRRLSSYLARATDEEVSRGMSWYMDAHYEAKHLAHEYGYHTMQTAAVIAALSPQKNWQENLKISKLFFHGVTDTHYRAQIQKAIDCSLSTPDESNMFYTVSKSGMKTSHFFMNIWNPYDKDYVTIDRHAVAAILYPPYKAKDIGEGDSRVTARQYNFIADCYKDVAQVHGILPNQAQAIIWTVLRRLKGLPDKYKTS